LQDRHGITPLQLLQAQLSIAVAISQRLQQLNALALMGIQLRFVLSAPGRAVRVFKHHLNPDATAMLRGQSLR